MKIEFVKNTGGIGYAYMEGQQFDFPEAFAIEMVELGYARIINQAKTELPEDLPARKILIENGITTIAELKRITDPATLTELKGIGPKVAQQIIDFVNR